MKRLIIMVVVILASVVVLVLFMRYLGEPRGLAENEPEEAIERAPSVVGVGSNSREYGNRLEEESPIASVQSGAVDDSVTDPPPSIEEKPSAFETSGLVSPSFVRRYQLTKREEEMINRALLSADEAMYEIASKGVVVEEVGDGEVSVYIGVYDGSSVYEKVLDVYEDTLGEERFARFLEQDEGRVYRRFEHVGAEETALLVENLGDVGGGTGQVSYRITEKRTVPHGELTRTIDEMPDEDFQKYYRIASRALRERARE